MSEHETRLRMEQLFLEIHSERIKKASRQIGDFSSWTRRRDMPLEDILMCTLAKNGKQTGLSAAAAKIKPRRIQNIEPELPQTVLRRAGSAQVARVSGNGSGWEPGGDTEQ
jgi:hypothetical protein